MFAFIFGFVFAGLCVVAYIKRDTLVPIVKQFVADVKAKIDAWRAK